MVKVDSTHDPPSFEVRLENGTVRETESDRLSLPEDQDKVGASDDTISSAACGRSQEKTLKKGSGAGAGMPSRDVAGVKKTLFKPGAESARMAAEESAKA